VRGARAGRRRISGTRPGTRPDGPRHCRWVQGRSQPPAPRKQERVTAQPEPRYRTGCARPGAPLDASSTTGRAGAPAGRRSNSTDRADRRRLVHHRGGRVGSSFRRAWPCAAAGREHVQLRSLRKRVFTRFWASESRAFDALISQRASWAAVKRSQAVSSRVRDRHRPSARSPMSRRHASSARTIGTPTRHHGVSPRHQFHQ